MANINSIVPSQKSDPVGSRDTFRPAMAKAGLKRTSRSETVVSQDHTGLAFNAVVRDAVVKHYGSVKAAAITLQVDASLMMREFDAGKFARLEQADDEAKAFIAEALHAAFGHPTDPKAQIRRAIQEARQRLDVVEALMQEVA